MSSWNAIDISADGMHAIFGNSNGQVYLSHDGGANVSLVTNQSGSARCAAISDDGTKYLVGMDPSGVYGAGITGTAGLVGPATTYYAVAMAGDGSNPLAVINDKFLRPSSNTSTSPVNTTSGASGYLTVSGEVTTVELQYIGNGSFVILSNKGTIAVN